MARDIAREVIATALPEDVDYVHSLGAHHVIDVRSTPFESAAKELDVVVDSVGGEMLVRSFAVLKPGGVLVSSVSVPDQELAARHQVRGVFFLVKVTTEGLTRIASTIDEGRLSTSSVRCWRYAMHVLRTRGCAMLLLQQCSSICPARPVSFHTAATPTCSTTLSVKSDVKTGRSGRSAGGSNQPCPVRQLQDGSRRHANRGLYWEALASARAC